MHQLADAKKMRAAIKDNKVVMQLGHDYNSMPAYHKAREIFRSGALGKVPLIRTYIDRAGDPPHVEVLHRLQHSRHARAMPGPTPLIGTVGSPTPPSGPSMPSGFLPGGVTGTTEPASPGIC